MGPIMSSLDEMRVFTCVVQLGSFAAAAQKLGRTPSAISKTIDRLETRLGVQLLVRTTRRLAVVAEGEIYLKRCLEILAAVEGAEAEVTGARLELSGRININAGTGIGRHQLATMLPAFLQLHPKVVVELGISDRRIDVLSENADIVLRAGALEDSSLISRKIAEGRRIVCASRRYLDEHGIPQAPTDLAHHNCIRLSNFDHLSRWPFRHGDGLVHVEVAGNILTDNADVMLDLAIAGVGIIRMTDTQVGPSIRAGLLLPILEEQHVKECVTFWALTPPGRNRVPRIRALLDYLAAELGKQSWRP